MASNQKSGFPGFFSLSTFALFARPFVGLVVSESTQQKVEEAVVEPTGVVHRTGVSLASMLLMKKLGRGWGWKFVGGV